MNNIGFLSHAFNPYADDIQKLEISTADDLRLAMNKCDSALSIGDDELRKVFKTFCYKFDYTKMPSDPWSDEYSSFQFDCYEKISEKKYSIQNERSNFIDVEKNIRHPFRFYTKSHKTVSDQLIMVGLIIRVLQLPPGSRILEFGAGWGNTAVNLSRMGYQVTVIDVEESFLEIVKGRSIGFDCEIETVVGDFTKVDELTSKFDAILFKECFHHSSNHHALIEKLSSKLSKDGVICFAGEPVYDNFPIPWGLQFDGESIWAIRNFGWLEFGFREDYFIELLKKNSYEVKKYQCDLVERGCFYVASKL